MFMKNMYPHFIGLLLLESIFLAQSLSTTGTLLGHFSPFLVESVTGKWHNNQNQRITLFTCSTDNLKFLRKISTGSQVSIATSPRSWNVTGNGKMEAFTFIIDLACQGVDGLLQQAGQNGLLKIPNRWLLLNLTDPVGTNENALILHGNDPQEVGSCRDLAVSLPQRGPGFGLTTATDADVTVACAAAGGTVALVDMWGAMPLGSWSTSREGFIGDRRPPSVRRLAAGLGGRRIRAVLVISKNESLEHLDDGKDIKTDNLSKFNWAIINNVMDMLNGTLEIALTKSFGQKINGTWNGAIGMLVRGEVEVTGSSVALVLSRLPLARFTAFTMPVNGIFIFRAPPLSYEHNLFTLPFPPAVWLASIAMVVLYALFLYGTLKAEGLATAEDLSSVCATSQNPNLMISEGQKRELKASWTDVVVLAFGAVCQQGSQVEARGVTGRMVTLFLFIAILFLYTSYSASIVALLQSTSTSIRTYKDLLHNKIILGVENKSYHTDYMKNTDDPLRLAIYHKKMKQNLLTIEEGVRRLRTSYFAFHGMQVLMYAEIADTFEENEKCGLVFIGKFLSVHDPMVAVSKWSKNTELFMIAFRKNQERGIRNRQIQRYIAHKPMCVNKGGNFQSVALIDCEVVFVVLGVGYGLSLLFLFVEHFVFRCQKAPSILNLRGFRHS